MMDICSKYDPLIQIEEIHHSRLKHIKTNMSQMFDTEFFDTKAPPRKDRGVLTKFESIWCIYECVASHHGYD